MTTTNWKTGAGRAITALPVAFLLFDGTIKLLGIKPVVDSFTQLGFDPRIAATIGILELVCLAIYLVPHTSLAGAILMTGYLGGAVAIHLRLDHPLFSHVLFPLYVGALLWSGLLLRNDRLRTMLPVSSAAH